MGPRRTWQGESPHEVQEASQGGETWPCPMEWQGWGKSSTHLRRELQAPDDDAKNSQLQGESGVGVAAGGLLK